MVHWCPCNAGPCPLQFKGPGPAGLDSQVRHTSRVKKSKTKCPVNHSQLPIPKTSAIYRRSLRCIKRLNINITVMDLLDDMVAVLFRPKKLLTSQLYVIRDVERFHEDIPL